MNIAMIIGLASAVTCLIAVVFSWHSLAHRPRPVEVVKYIEQLNRNGRDITSD